MTGTTAPNCSFCGRSASKAGLLMQSQYAAICEDCCRTGLELAEDHRSGRLTRDGRVRIADYLVDARLARAIGKPSLLRYPFVPLSVNDERVVVALTDVAQMKDIQALVAGAWLRATGSECSTDSIDAVLADNEAILDKIHEALPAQLD